MEFSFLHEVEECLELLARLFEVLKRRLEGLILFTQAFTCVQEVFEHDQPQLAEKGAELFDILRELLLMAEEHKA